MSRIKKSKTVYSNAWLSVVSKTLRNGEPGAYYSLKLQDYVTVLAMTRSREVLLVRQYRPAVEKNTIELPSGHVDAGETPSVAARRELLEETGFKAGHLTELGCLYTDSGRLGNRLWCFFAGDVKLAKGSKPEPGVGRLRVSEAAFVKMIRGGRFGHALNLAVVAMAVFKKKFKIRG